MHGFASNLVCTQVLTYRDFAHQRGLGRAFLYLSIYLLWTQLSSRNYLSLYLSIFVLELCATMFFALSDLILSTTLMVNAGAVLSFKIPSNGGAGLDGAMTFKERLFVLISSLRVFEDEIGLAHLRTQPERPAGHH